MRSAGRLDTEIRITNATERFLQVSGSAMAEQGDIGLHGLGEFGQVNPVIATGKKRKYSGEEEMDFPFVLYGTTRDDNYYNINQLMWAKVVRPNQKQVDNDGSIYTINTVIYHTRYFSPNNLDPSELVNVWKVVRELPNVNNTHSGADSVKKVYYDIKHVEFDSRKDYMNIVTERIL